MFYALKSESKQSTAAAGSVFDTVAQIDSSATRAPSPLSWPQAPEQLVMHTSGVASCAHAAHACRRHLHTALLTGLRRVSFYQASQAHSCAGNL